MTWYLPCSNTLHSLPSQEAHPKIDVPRSSLLVILQLYSIHPCTVYNYQVKNATQQVQQYKDMITEFKEQKQIY